jgi:hypothetical protein
MIVIVRINAPSEGKIVVCQPGSREMAKSFKNRNETEPYTTKNVRIPDMN